MLYERFDTRTAKSCTYGACNNNFFKDGHVDVIAFNDTSILLIVQGVSTKTSGDWFLQLHSAYRPYTYMYFPYYLGTALHYGHVQSDNGAVLLDTLNNTECISAVIGISKA